MTDSAADAARWLVTSFLDAVETRDLESIVTHFSDDAFLSIPLAVNGEPEPWFSFEGIDQIRAYWSNAVTSLDRIMFTDRRITVGADASVVFCESVGDMEGGGDPYRNVYVLRFDVLDGKISRLLEYANPITAVRFAGGSAISGLESIDGA